MYQKSWYNLTHARMRSQCVLLFSGAFEQCVCVLCVRVAIALRLCDDPFRLITAVNKA